MTSPPACRRDSRPLTTHPSAVAPGGVGQPSEVPPTVPQRGAMPPIAASWVYSTYTHGLAGKFGSSASPSRPRSQKLCTWVRKSANTVGVASFRFENTFTMPLFSATKTRPSLANRTAVGCVSPLNTISSWKPLGTEPPCTAGAEISHTTDEVRATTNAIAIRPAGVSPPLRTPPIIDPAIRRAIPRPLRRAQDNTCRDARRLGLGAFNRPRSAGRSIFLTFPRSDSCSWDFRVRASHALRVGNGSAPI